MTKKSDNDSASGAFVQVYQGNDATESYLIRDWLTRNGIHADVRGFDLLTASGEIPFGQQWPTLWVAQRNVDAARKLIDSYSEPVQLEAVWTCTACEEVNEPNFASCWSCSVEKPGIQ